jgi:hypothetical protein
MLALHLLQSSLVRINTLLLQEVLKEPQWADRLTARPRHHQTAAVELHPTKLIGQPPSQLRLILLTDFAEAEEGVPDRTVNLGHSRSLTDM